MKSEQKNWPLLPENTIIKDKVIDYIYEGEGEGFRLLLQCIYNTVNPPHSLPLNGGYLDQPLAFHQAIRMFKYGKTLYEEKGNQTRELMKQLGAKK